MNQPIPLRRWRKNVTAGKLDVKNRQSLKEMGWTEWVCEDHALKKRTNSVAHLLAGINNPCLLDHLFINLRNGYTLSRNKKIYETIELRSIATGKLTYTFKIDCGYERMRYVIYTHRVWDGPLFETNTPKSLWSWFNQLTEKELTA